MGIIANLSVSVSAETDKFARGMKEAAGDVDEFSVSSRAGRIAAVQLGDALGGSGLGKELGGAVQAFLLMGPAIGSAVAAMEVYNTVVKQSEENAQNAISNAQDLAKSIELVGKATGTIPREGFFDKKFDADIEEISKKLIKLRDQRQKLEEVWIQTPGSLKTMIETNAVIGKQTDELDKLIKLKQENKDANLGADKFKEDEFQIKTRTHSGTDDRDIQEKEALLEYNKKLSESMDLLPPKGEAYNSVLEKWRENYIKILDLTDDIDKKNKQAEDAAEKIAEKEEEREKEKDRIIAKRNEAIEKQEEAANKAARSAGDKLTESLQTPMEKFKEEIEKLGDLLGEGVISEETYNRAIEKYKSDARKAEKKEDKTEKDGSFVKLSSRMNAEGLKGQNKGDPKLDKTNALLEEIVKQQQDALQNNGNNGPAILG